MEEWHQKLHNNTSPDDVVICRALLDYIAGREEWVGWRADAVRGLTVAYYKASASSSFEARSMSTTSDKH